MLVRTNAHDCGNGLPFLVSEPVVLQARGDVATGLVTGNLEPIGWGKMEALGILSLFSKPRFGGFGSDFCSGNIAESWKDRGELVRIAAKRAEESMPGSLALLHRYLMSLVLHPYYCHPTDNL